MIDTVIAHKDRIVKTTNEIIEKLSGPQKSYISEKEASLYVKKTG